MRRALAAAVLLIVVGAAGYAALRWYRHEQRQPLPQRRGSSTEEFIPKETHATKRPQKLVRAEPWPLYGYNAARTRFAPDFRHRPPYKVVWKFSSGSLLEFPPIVVDDRVIFGHLHGDVFALRAENGKLAWGKRFGRCMASSPAAARGVAYIALLGPAACPTEPRTQRGEVVAIRVRDGRVLWRWTKTGATESSPLLVHGILYFGSWDRHLYALDVRGKRPRLRWKFLADDEVQSSPAYAAGSVYFGTNGGHVYGLDAKTGRDRWRAASFARFGGGREYFYATPAVAYGRVFAPNTDGNVYAYGATTGRLLWASNAGSYAYAAPAIWHKTVYVGSYDGYMYAFDAATGARRWRQWIGASIHGAATVIDGLLYFATCGTCGHRGSRHAAIGPRYTYALDARTGRVVWKFFAGHYSPVVADAKRLYVVGTGRVYALTDRRRQHARPRRTPAPPATR